MRELVVDADENSGIQDFKILKDFMRLLGLQKTSRYFEII